MKNLIYVLMLKNFMQIVKSKTRKRLYLCKKKMEIPEYYATHKNYRDMVRVFGHQDSIVRIIYKEAPPKKDQQRAIWWSQIK